MALHFECRINKNALLQTDFWRFCPRGYFILLHLLIYCKISFRSAYNIFCLNDYFLTFLLSI